MILRIKFIYFGLFSLAVFLSAFYFFYLLGPVSKAADTKDIVFKIVQGAGLKEISSELKSLNLIKSEKVFKIYSIFSGDAHLMKPGVYKINNNYSIPRIVEALVYGPKDIPVTIFPGMTLKEFDERISSYSLVEPGEVGSLNIDEFGKELTNFDNQAIIGNKEEKNLEGFLFPDTYYFSPSSGARDIVIKVLENFGNKTSDLFQKSRDHFQSLILASLLEKEAPDFEEKRIIAGILIKRFEAGMPLQVDATVIYTACSGKFLNCPKLKESDFSIDSSYNTYKYKGFPPGPISNPGADSIRAAVEPKVSDYWYYLSDPETKQTIFSKTLDEHNDNRVKYLLNK